MYTFGIDIGSTTSKCAILKDGTEIVSTALLVGGIGTKSPASVVEQALSQAGLTREDMAAMLAERFKKSPERLYSEIMRVLMSSDPEDDAEK